MATDNENNKKINHIDESMEDNLSKNESRNMLPEDDPAVINPDELATFPKQKKTEHPDLEEERDSHLANKISSPVRKGRNITQTGTMPDENGFM